MPLSDLDETSAEANRALITRWYEALAAGDFEAIFEMHHDDVVYNMVGNTPVSGRIHGKDACRNGIIAEKLLEKLVPGEFRFAKAWTIVAAEGDRVVGLMQGGGPTVNGGHYDQTYCEIFTIRGAKIVEMHNFFDTVLVEECLFDNSLAHPEVLGEDPFQVG
jgi:ketosteroid isomerase-like protein